MFRKLKNKKGFTLVELMVVVVIICILVAIAVPIYNSSTAKAQEKACLANLRTLDSAIAQYAADNNGDYPTQVSQLASYVNNAGSMKCPSDSSKEYEIDSNHLAVCTNGHTLP